MATSWLWPPPTRPAVQGVTQATLGILAHWLGKSPLTELPSIFPEGCRPSSQKPGVQKLPNQGNLCQEMALPASKSHSDMCQAARRRELWPVVGVFLHCQQKKSARGPSSRIWRMYLLSNQGRYRKAECREHFLICGYRKNTADFSKLIAIFEVKRIEKGLEAIKRRLMNHRLYICFYCTIRQYKRKEEKNKQKEKENGEYQ